MNAHDDGTEKMITLNAASAGVAIGLLLQQASAFNCEKVDVDSPVQQHHVRNVTKHDVQEALSAINDLTNALHYSYHVLAGADEENVPKALSIIDPAKSQLIEIQLRGLEGAIRLSYKSATGNFKEEIKNVYSVVALARSAISNLNGLIKQRTSLADVFDGSADMVGLKALADHGSKVFHSGNFH